MVQYAPDDCYHDNFNDDLIQCDKCGEDFTEEDAVDVKICKGKMTITVCRECYEKHYFNG